MKSFVLCIVCIVLFFTHLHSSEIVPRGSLQNSFIKFEKEGFGRVTFLGGSITRMDAGWRGMIEEELKIRFPDTNFDFIGAGIGSTGSTPGAFRLENDVLSKGDIDLLFVEAAVNDYSNGFSPEEQVRGMEGIVRHALQEDAETDIVMLHFICDDFIKMHLEGKIPDVIFNHERVANHYSIPSINLSQEVCDRMADGEFSWKDFGGIHPLELGHKIYAASISELFDIFWQQNADQKEIIKHKVPEPLDEYSYSNGRFVDISKAKLSRGAYIDKQWNPQDKYQKREGFVDVPMLVLDIPKSKVSLEFSGKAIGLFVVSGPSSGILEYSIDGGPYKITDTYTRWSGYLYIPWLFMLETELSDGPHEITIRMSNKSNEKSKGTECQIRNFVVN